MKSRFGLLTCFHKGRLHAGDDAADACFVEERSRGIYATHAFDAQLDLLYAYAQYELAKVGADHLTLYRGVNTIDDFDILERTDPRAATVVLNAMNSFTADPDRDGEILGVRVVQHTETPASATRWISAKPGGSRPSRAVL